MNSDVYDTMMDNSECWALYDDGCAILVGAVDTSVAMDN